MATKTGSTKSSGASSEASEKVHELLDNVQKSERSALDAMHRFADSINDSFPDVGEEGEGPRSKIIAAAFKMTGDIVESGHRMAVNVIDVTGDAVRNLGKKQEAAAG